MKSFACCFPIISGQRSHRKGNWSMTFMPLFMHVFMHRIGTNFKFCEEIL